MDPFFPPLPTLEYSDVYQMDRHLAGPPIIFCYLQPGRINQQAHGSPPPVQEPVVGN